MDAKIFRVNYKSDFILTLTSDAGWMTPFCIKFWTGSPQLAYYASYDGETHVHCTYDPADPTKLTVQFDDHHLPIGNLKYQVAYHFTVADFPENTEDEVTNQANVTTVIDGDTYQVMLDLNGETAPEIQFALPAYANELQRIQNEQQRIENEQQRITQEQTRISQEAARVTEFNGIKAEALADHQRANDDHARAANDHTQANTDHLQADNDHTRAESDHLQANSDHTRAESDHATATADHDTASADHTQASTDHSQAESDHTRAESDHTTATADHNTASADHTQANTDHARAESDHERVETDLAEVEEFSNSLGAYDISAANATGSTLATYTDLTSALGTNGTNIPEAIRKPGMSVKFILSSDNNTAKYMQYRLMSDTFSTNVANWQGVDEMPVPGSKSLTESGGVVNYATDKGLYGTPLVDLPLYNRWIRSSTGVWDKGKHSYVPIKGGDSINITCTDSTLTFAFVKSINDHAVTGDIPDYCDDTSVIVLSSTLGRTWNGTAPNDAKYFLIGREYNQDERTGYIESLTVNGYDIVKGLYNTLGNISTDTAFTFKRKLTSADDMNDITESGWYYTTSSDIPSNYIGISTGGTILVFKNGANGRIVQVFFPQGNNVAIRYRRKGTVTEEYPTGWYSWKTVIPGEVFDETVAEINAAISSSTTFTTGEIVSNKGVDKIPAPSSGNFVESNGVASVCYRYVLQNRISSVTGKIQMLADGHLEDSLSSMAIYTYNIDPQKRYRVGGYRGTTDDSCMIAYFDSSDVYIGYEIKGSIAKVINDYMPTIPSEASYIRITGRSERQLPVLEEIVVAFDMLDETNERVSSLENDTEKYVAIGPENTISGYIINGSTGELISSISGMRIKEYAINPEKEYIADGYIGNTSGTVMIAYYNGTVYISGEVPSTGSGSAHVVNDYKLTVPANATVVRVVGRSPGVSYQVPVLRVKYKVFEAIDALDVKIEDINARIDEVHENKPRMYNPTFDFKKEGLKILDIGNSYTKDAQHYLSDIITAASLPTTGYSLYRYYRGSGSFKTDVNCYNDADTEGYEVTKVLGDNITGITTGEGQAGNGALFRNLLTGTKWDVIIIHQASTYSTDYSQWFGTGNGGFLKELIQIIRNSNPQATIGTLLIHSYRSTYSKNTEGSSLLRWGNISKAIIEFINDCGVDFVIPYGTAVQNLRASSLNDEYEFSTDGTHMADGIGDYVSSCCYYQSLFAPRFDVSIVGNTYRNTSLDESTSGVKVINDANALLAQKAAMFATYNMFEINNPDDY